MAITAEAPNPMAAASSCTGCGGAKGAPLAAVVHIAHHTPEQLMMKGVTITLCQECGRDAANAIGFMCIRDGGWSKLEPRKRKPKTT